MRNFGIRLFSWLRQPANFFLSVSLFIGILIVIILPPFRGPDEAAHVFRIYEISKGDLFLDKGVFEEKDIEGNGYAVPNALSRVNQQAFKDTERDFWQRIGHLYEEGSPKQGDGMRFELFEGAGLYSPLSYVNYVLTSSVLRFINVNEYIYTLILRLSGLIFSVLLIYLAIRLIPLGKWLVVAIGLLPMTLHQMSVVSTDGAIIAASILFVAAILGIRNSNVTAQASNTKRIATYIGLFLLACIISSKPGYWPVLLVVGILINKPSELIKRAFRPYLLIVAASMLIYIFWYGLLNIQHQANTKRFFEQANPQSTLITKREFINQAVNPFTLTEKFYNTYISHPTFEKINGDFAPNFQPSFIFNTFVGSFGSLAINPPSWLSITVIGSLIVSLLFSYTKRINIIIGKWGRMLGAALLASSFIIISLIFWMSWTTSDMPFIFGVQGRYFLPLLILLIFFIPKSKVLTFTDKSVLKALIILISINCFITITTIHSYFYL